MDPTVHALGLLGRLGKFKGATVVNVSLFTRRSYTSLNTETPSMSLTPSSVQLLGGLSERTLTSLGPGQGAWADTKLGFLARALSWPSNAGEALDHSEGMQGMPRMMELGTKALASIHFAISLINSRVRNSQV